MKKLLKQKVRAIHAMLSKDASKKKRTGHANEKDFNTLFGKKNNKINYSGPSSDCTIEDTLFMNKLKDTLKVEGNRVSLKSGDTIQIHLGWFPELTLREIWIQNLRREKRGDKEYTTSKHGILLADQIGILKKYDFWMKYLAKGDILCYRASKNKWIFFNMQDIVRFVINNIEWRLLDTGRLKGDFEGHQYLTYEYRSEYHKKCFVLGAHGGKKGKEFIELLMKYLPFLEEIR